MFERLYPKAYIKSIYGYDFARAWDEGVRGLLFDVDNTLVPHDAPGETKSAALMKRLRTQGFQLMIVSNNHEPRVKAFAEASGIPGYIYLAHKPSPKGYLAACKKMGLKPQQVRFFGDQIFTDIWGANNAGVYSVLVEPIDRSTDLFKIRLKRLLEKPVLFCYFRKCRKEKQSSQKAGN